MSKLYYPENFEDKVGFVAVRQKLENACLSELGREFVSKMRFTNDFEQLQIRLWQLKEFINVFQEGEPINLSHFTDPKDFFNKVNLSGAFLTEEEFSRLLASMQTVISLLHFFDEREEKYPQLYNLSQKVGLDAMLIKNIASNFNAEGLLHDHASADLKRLRIDIKQLDFKSRKLVDSIFRDAKSKGYVPDGQSITVREGRLVVPILAEHKRKIKGYIQGESATGQMIYFEPAESIEINNELRALQFQERREVVKILSRLTEQIRPQASALASAYRFMAIIDFIQAKARIAIQWDSDVPQLENKPLIEWRDAKNVNLMFSFKAQGKKVVPLSMKLTDKKRIMIISGPNAGGKSVALKTVGLLQYMLQCGMAVPVQADSKFGIFQQLLIDIGDEQSIENDLSTYSSHLTNMKSFINRANKNTLFLIDEFGTGTEPQIGAAVAEAVLDELYHFGSFGLITTHYENIKHYAEMHPQVLNAAMRFDQDKIEPLYELEVGKPGSSFALELAQKIGLPEKVLQKAKNMTGTAKVDYELLLNKLEQDKQQVDNAKKHALKKEEELKELALEYQNLKNHLEQQKNKIVREAKLEAKRLLDDANKNIENTIRTIKEHQADKEKTKAARTEFDRERKKIESIDILETKAVKTVPKKESGPIQVGDSVMLDDSEAIGEVLAIKGKEAHISFGGLTSFVKIKRLSKVSKAEHRRAERTTSRKGGVDMNRKMESFSAEIDIRGMRAEEAVGEVDRVLDSALMLNQKSIRIIHGKGNGILRQVIRDYIKQYDFVSSFENEHVERGGDGITIAHLG